MTIDQPNRAQIPSLKRLWKEAFGDTDAFLEIFEKTAFATERCRCVTEDGQAVAALYWFNCMFEGRRIAYLYAVATAKSHRRKGLCRKLMNDTHHHLQAQGYEGAILVPDGENLFAFYQTMGYRTCAYVCEFTCNASGTPLAIKTIDRDEYAALRRHFLPQGGVVQEGENLNFLQAQADFYTGDGFLLAARREGDTLCGMELLGDLTVAPDLVRTFDCQKGRFRAPGKEIPFAMYRFLGTRCGTLPTYFGLAFD